MEPYYRGIVSVEQGDGNIFHIGVVFLDTPHEKSLLST
jgi:hypothetical protein